MTCLVTSTVAGLCACGKPMEPAHVIDGKRPTCADCCSEHNASHEWEAAPAVEAEQASLFESGKEEYPE